MKKQLFLFLLFLLPLKASADESGTCGDNLTWTYVVETQTLTISGNGVMEDFNNIQATPWYYFYYSIKSIIIESGVTSIGNNAFSRCNVLSSITIPNSLTSIGSQAFSGCSNLTSITIPNSLTSIGNDAFYNCSLLQKIIVNDISAWCNISFGSEYSNPLYFARHIYSDENTEITNLIIPEGVTSIGRYAFYNCSDLTSITIPNSVTSIGNSAFYGCSSLTSLDIPDSVTSIGNYAFSRCFSLTSVTIGNNVTSIGNSAFSECSGLTSITIPNSVKAIGEYAFASCTGLTSFTNGNSVTSIGNYAFFKCTHLTSINFGDSVTSIGEYVFSGCYSLTSITLPNSVISIGSSAFYNCYNLTSINISSSVQNIGESAFRRCPRLHTIYSLNPIPPNCHGTQTFASDSVRSQYDIYNYAVLHVPMGSKEIYGSAYEWRYFQKIKEDMQLDGNIYYANLTVQQGTTGYTRQAIKAGETYTIYIGSFGDNRVNAVTFNGVDVTEEIVNGNYTTPEITGESVLCISYEIPSSAPSLKLNNVKVMGYNGEITISNIDEPSDISIYSADGKIVDNIPSASGTTKINVTPDQLYVVKVGYRTYKIAL